ncbi:ethanolamine ammonia-lyase subunit EutB, partial [Clostridioides difficile]|uniref:ethanolamine ammonia-lyase subunit EutB n=1 Tax=Clostridioides difficile TaxID=1496 RepID=UPI00130420E4
CEKGQGSELRAVAQHGRDQVTIEDRGYGVAKKYEPFVVNTVVGFIGPEYLYDAREVVRAGLEDHFMGKLHGLPMGVDVCYTNHMKADQNDMDNLAILLTTAGCPYFMVIPHGDDVMLNYQTTVYHETASLRVMLGLTSMKEFESWMGKV